MVYTEPIIAEELIQHIEKKNDINITKDADTIIIMSCPGGFKAVESYLDNKKLIMGMRVKGFKSPKIKVKTKGVYVE